MTIMWQRRAVHRGERRRRRPNESKATAPHFYLTAEIDMGKAVDRGAQLTDVRLIAKAGGRSGEWVRP